MGHGSTFTLAYRGLMSLAVQLWGCEWLVVRTSEIVAGIRVRDGGGREG